MPIRPLTIVSADPTVVSACEAAAAAATEHVAAPRVIGTREELDTAADALTGLIVIDPDVFGSASAHEWTLAFLRRAQGLVFLLTRGDLEDADGLARFVGAQGALAKPVDARKLAERLKSPFGITRSIKPSPITHDETAIGDGIAAILEGRDPSPRDRFLATITNGESGLYTGPFFEHRLDEEFKRAHRFRFPLGLAGFAFDSDVDEGTMLDLAGVILLDTRDVDIVAQFDERTFLALLPHTGPAGSVLFSERVVRELQDRGLVDLEGKPLNWRFATSNVPDSDVPTVREMLMRVLGPLRSQTPDAAV